MGSFGPTVPERLNPSIERTFRLVDSILDQMRVALPAVVQTFYAGPPATVDVQIATQELAQWNQAAPGAPVQLSTQLVAIAPLTGVPVAIYGAGGWSFTLPVQAGDECLVLFLDADPHSWFQSGGANNLPISSERHCLSNAIAIFGLRSTPRSLSNYSTGSAQLRSDDGNTVIDLASNGITVTAQNVTINAASTATIQAETVNIEGSSAVNITGNNATKIDNKTFVTHTHSGVASGGSDTGPVV